MQIFTTISEIREHLRIHKEDGKSIGFVPTMGSLHKGHLDLLSRANNENSLSVCSIFVNPIQFNNKEDLKKYPRDLSLDEKKLKSVNCEVLFAPEVEEMYPEEVTKKYDFGALETVMEGKFRQGHFNGVAVVVKKLFDIVEPDKAYFGEKDFQQLAIVEKLVQVEKIDVKIVPCETVREHDGLAMSSRNSRLSKEERKLAPAIYDALKFVRSNKGSFSIDDMINKSIDTLNNVEGMEIEYFDIVDAKTLQHISNWDESTDIVACVAAFLGSVRLIDNMRIPV